MKKFLKIILFVIFMPIIYVMVMDKKEDKSRYEPMNEKEMYW